MLTRHNYAQMEISQPLNGSSTAFLLEALCALAEARQAAVSDSTLRLYVPQLSAWPLEDVKKVCAKLALTPRGEGETAFPTLGTFQSELAAMKAVRARENARYKLRESDLANLWEHLAYEAEQSAKPKHELLEEIRRIKPGYANVTLEEVERAWRRANGRAGGKGGQNI